MRRTPRLRAAAADVGVSLVELLVAVVIMGLVGGSIVSVAVASFRTEQVVTETRAAMDDARLAVERIRGDVREARRVQPGSDPTTLILWMDADRDGAIDPTETITYRMIDDSTATACPGGDASGTARVTRQVDAGAQQIVACQIRMAAAFTYDGNPVQSVTLTLTARSRLDDRGASTLEITDVVRLRNVG